MIKDALFYERVNDKVKCLLCPHNCLISNEKYGVCNVRKNEGGELKTINYGEITSIGADPIEKKPLYHFKPGYDILSVGTFGCNFSCSFCQNYQIAHFKPDSRYLSSDDLLYILDKYQNNCGIAFTYNEPTIWFEYVYDTAKLLKEKHPDKNVVLVTNGFINEEPLLKILPYVDAMNIDLKSFSEEYYKKICGGGLEKVKKTIELAYRMCHIEITTLLVSDLNDSLEEVESIASFLGNISKDIPLHLSRYFPTYKMNKPATDIEVMERSKEVAKKYLNYVYIGNVENDNSTYCPNCYALLIERNFYKSEKYIEDNKCTHCGEKINIII